MDHVIVAVADLEAAAARFATLGLDFSPGGVHPTGTVNWVCRFSDLTYLELLGVNDESKPGGQAVRRFLDAHGDGLFGWAVQTEDIIAEASRLGLSPRPGSITDAEGRVLGSWQTLLPPRDDVPAGLPFFIQYDGRDRAGRIRVSAATAGHRLVDGGVRWLEVAAPTDEIQRWIGPNMMDIRLVEGEPGLRRVAVEVDGRIVEITH